MNERRFLACDLGAESGRAVVGTVAGRRLSLEEVHRFPNRTVEWAGTLYWDLLSLCNNVLEGMRAYSHRFGRSVDGIGIDTWGVDFGLLAEDGALLQNPVHYRDRRTEGILDHVGARMSPARLFRCTGLSPSPIYSLCQLLSLRLSGSPILPAAGTFLMMPDLFAFFLTGRTCCERTAAVLTQLYDPRRGDWHDGIFDAFDLPRSMMPELVDPGTVLGDLRESVKRETGLEEAVVIAPCAHDTASAVAAVPSTGEDWAFLSSGTWSVLGALTDEVVATQDALSAGMCNELTLQDFFLRLGHLSCALLPLCVPTFRLEGCCSGVGSTRLTAGVRRFPARPEVRSGVAGSSPGGDDVG